MRKSHTNSLEMLNSTDCSLLGKEIHPPANASLYLDNLKEPFIQSIAAVQLIISFLGVFGNILSLVVLATTKSLHTTPNLYIGVLASVDLVICFIIPVSTVQILIKSDSDTLPPDVCKFIGSAIMISLSASLFCMMLIAVNRYILIVKGRAVYNKIYTKTNNTLILAFVFIWLLLIIVIIPETTNFGHFGYNAKFGTCIVVSYCFVTYIYMVVLASSTIFLPASLVTGWAYYKIIRKLLVMRRKIELREQMNVPRPSLAFEDLDTKDSGVELSHVPANVDDNAEMNDEDEDNDDNSYDQFEEPKLKDEYSVHQKTEVVSCLCSPTAHKPTVVTFARTRTENSGLMSFPDTESAKTREMNVRGLNEEKRPSNSFIRRLSPPKLRIKAPKSISKLRRRQWRRLCLAIANMIVIYIVLWVCWAPMILQYVIDLHGLQPAYSYKIEVTFVYFNSAFNVILYAIMNNTHRKAYKKLLIKCFTCSKVS